MLTPRRALIKAIILLGNDEEITLLSTQDLTCKLSNNFLKLSNTFELPVECGEILVDISAIPNEEIVNCNNTLDLWDILLHHGVVPKEK